MSDAQASKNVIQFPQKKAESRTQAKAETAKISAKVPGKNVAGTVVATVLASLAVNHYVFSNSANQAALDLSSMSRSIASVDRFSWKRDAEWEKQLAENLASTQLREIASVQIGRPANSEEKLRWGTLEEKYTITYRPEAHLIETVSLQDPNSAPSYVLDRGQFLRQYGHLLDSSFASATLKSVESSSDKTVEFYELLDKDQKPRGETRFELDRHKRLISLKVELSKI